ncbi:MAG: replicative DNA helicase, partial [Bacteroidales bacterium]
MQLSLPECRDLEEVVLGAMLIEKGCADTALRTLSEEMFSRSDLAFVFRGIKQTMERLHTCDMLLVVQELMRMDSALASALGVPYLVASLVGQVYSGVNLSFHIAVMKEKYMMREFILKSSALTNSAFDPETNPEDLVSEMQKLCGFMMEQLYAEDRTLSMKDVVDRTFDLYYDKAKRSEAGGIPGVTSGVDDLDTVLGGWGKSTLNIIAARPGMGKTAFMLFAALAAVRDNRRAAILSLEMDATQLGGRILQGQSGVNDKCFRLGMLDEVGIQLMEDTADSLVKLPLYINDH